MLSDPFPGPAVDLPLPGVDWDRQVRWKGRCSGQIDNRGIL